MAEFSPIARSPIAAGNPIRLLDGWEVSRHQSNAALRLQDLTACAILLLRDTPTPAPSKVLPPFGRAQRVPGGPLIVAVVPGQWLLIGVSTAVSAIGDWINSNFDGSVLTLTDLTHARTLLRLVGAQSVMLLSKLCAINFNATTFPGGTAVRSSLAKVPCEIIRDDLPYPQAGCPSTSLAALSFLVICERPVGEYIFDAIIDAGSEYQIDIEGFPVD